MQWYRNPSTRWLLRAIGLVTLLISWRACAWLYTLVHGHPNNHSALVYLLALVAFCCASAGSALLVVGHHLFDEVQISERWATRQPRQTEPDRPERRG